MDRREEEMERGAMGKLAEGGGDGKGAMERGKR